MGLGGGAPLGLSLSGITTRKNKNVKKNLQNETELDVVAHTYNSGSRKAEAGGFWQVGGQPGLKVSPRV